LLVSFFLSLDFCKLFGCSGKFIICACIVCLECLDLQTHIEHPDRLLLDVSFETLCMILLLFVVVNAACVVFLELGLLLLVLCNLLLKFKQLVVFIFELAIALVFQKLDLQRVIRLGLNRLDLNRFL
jgi:hypothetical protein